VRRILYFTSEESHLYASSGSGLQLEARFPAGEAGVLEFREYLGAHRGALFSLLADVAGEDFHEEQIPYLRGSDRDAVLRRRLAQRYRDTRLAAAFSLGQVAAEERRNERVLLASFTNTQQLAPWLDALEESGARLAGVYSVPLLAPALAARLGVRSGRAFLVSTDRAGLRQSYIENGRLRFARLERTVDTAPQALALFVRSETQRLAQYLATLRAMPRDATPIQVLVIAPPGERHTFEQVLTSDARLTFRTVDAADAARAAGLRALPEGASAEALYVHLAARRAPREQFANRDDRRRFLVWQLQRGIVAAGAAAFAACALFAGARWLEASDVRGRAADQTTEARGAAERYQRITASFPVTQTSTENLRVTVTEFSRIAAGTASPEAAFAHVSRVLDEFPQLELDRIDFTVGPPDPRERAPAASATPAQRGAKGDAQGDAVLRLEVSGRVNATERNDYRGITAQVRRFASALGTSGYQLARTELPFDVTSEGTLTGDIGAGRDSGEAPRFTIVVLRRLP
jgi:HAMP domain-containing protein